MKKASNAERDAVIASLYYKKGERPTDIARLFHLSRQRIYQILQSHGNPSRSAWKQVIAEKTYKYLCGFKERNDGNTPSMNTIRKKTNLCTYHRVWVALRELESDGKIEVLNDRPLHIKIIGGCYISGVTI